MVRIYDEKGYLNVKEILTLETPFIFIIGGRAIGKTYGFLKTVYEEKTKFFYLRRTQAQVDIISKPEFSPFKSINHDCNYNIGVAPITKYSSGFYNMEENDSGKVVACGSPVGYIGALSTFSNLRGFDSSDVEVLIYDEFIPEKHERPIKNEADAFLNAYETINRNRELDGRKPLKAICLANANDMANAIFMSMGLVKIAENMKKKNKEIYINIERGYSVIMPKESPISEKKKNTALYRFAGDTEFSEMSLCNDFSSEEIGKIKSCNLKEYKPVVSVGEITIYKHKTKRLFYATTHKSGTPETFGSGDIELKRFRKSYGYIWREYIANRIEFEEYYVEILLTKYFK